MGCSAITLRKLESEERRPSKQIAERLADILSVPPAERAAFLRFARGDPFAAPGDIQAPTPDEQPPAPRHNLPLQLTSFIGREKEIGEVTRLLSSARLVTLTGAGGSGKTRLALAVASGVLDQFPDGAWLVELAPLADPSLVPNAFVTVLGVRELPGQPLADLLVTYLRPKRLLLLLDNCEHVIQASADLAQKLLQACPYLTILATSREALNIPGEAASVVPSLSVPQDQTVVPVEDIARFEATQLFVERAAAALPGFSVTPANAAGITRICRQLDGIPLAVELAAARVKVLRIEQIVMRLEDRFRLLTGGSRTARPRQQTLQALIDWSYDLLPPAEQTLLRRLAVFAGGWTLSAAEIVGAGGNVLADEVFDLLGRLVDKSLVQVNTRAALGVPRYDLLETIRQYALNKLVASGEADEVRQRHAVHYLAVWETGHAATDGLQGWLHVAEMELDNLRAALTWSRSPAANLELGLRLSALVPTELFGFTEARAWLEGALTNADGGRAKFPQVWGTVLTRLGELDALQADYASAGAHLEESLRHFQKLGDTPECAWLLGRLGWLAREQGDTAAAREKLVESIGLYRELGQQAGLAEALNSLGEVAVMEGDTAEARKILNEALALNQAVGEADSIGWSLNHLGHVAQLAGEFERAAGLHHDGLDKFRAVHVRYVGVGEANQSLGETTLAQGKADLAAYHFREALELFQFHGARSQISCVWRG